MSTLGWTKLLRTQIIKCSALRLAYFRHFDFSMEVQKWKPTVPGLHRVRQASQQHSYTSPVDRTFQHSAEETLQSILNSIELLVDDNSIDVDVSFEAGVLTIDCGSNGIFVLNKQAPNKQIWLASPISGPHRYNYNSSGEWANTRDGHLLQNRLQREMEYIHNIKIQL